MEEDIETQTSGKVHLIIVNFIRLLLFLAVIGSYYKGRWLVFLVAGLALFVTFLPSLLSKHYNIDVPAELEVTIILFIYGILFLGEVQGFYAEFWWWNVLLNLLSAIALGFVGLTILYVLQKEDRIDASPLMINILVFCFALAIGTLWEIFEFILDQTLKFNLQRASLTDTMTDLLVNAIGAALVVIGSYIYTRLKKVDMLSGVVLKLIKKYPQIFRAKHKRNPASELKKLLRKGESETQEFKQTLRTNIHTNEIDKNIEFSALKTIVAFLNSQGGTLLIGVSDQGKPTGIEKDNFQNNDKAKLHLTNLIKQHIGNSFIPFIHFGIIQIDGKNILKINCKQSNKRVFLKIGDEEEFYVRNGPASIKLKGSSMLDYIEHKFAN